MDPTLARVAFGFGRSKATGAPIILGVKTIFVGRQLIAENQKARYTRPHDRSSARQDRWRPFRRRPAAAKGARNFCAEDPAQPIEKSRFGRENPRKSKEIQ
jgi:hypothetical protein